MGRFLIENRYTYIKELRDLNYHQVTIKNIEKAGLKNYKCKAEVLSTESLKLNLEIFKEIGVGKNKINKIEKLLLDLAETNSLVCYNCYDENELVASNILFVDNEFKIAYTVLLNKVKKSKDDIHSLLHHYFFTDLKDKGFTLVDLLGADMPGVSAFKSRFNARLEPHFLVKYSSTSQLTAKILGITKNAVKKVLKKLN